MSQKNTYLKMFNLVMALMITLQLASGVAQLNVASAAAIGDNIITGVKLTGPDDKPIEDGGIYEQGSEVTIDYTWALPNGHGYAAGDTFTFSIPDQFLLFNDITGDLKLSGDESVGTFSVTKADHKVVLTFNDYITSHDNVQGTIHLATEFDTKVITGSTTQTIVFPVDGGNATYTLNFKPTVPSTIAKSGTPEGFNAEKINWTIDVNKKLEQVENAVVTDAIPAGLSLDASSIAVYRLDVNLDGSVTEGALVDANEYTTTLAADILTLNFLNNLTSAYRIKYVTDITDVTKNSFKNAAKFVGKGGKPSAEASATVAVNYGKMLEKPKPAYDAASQTVSWKVKFNYREQRITAAEALLTDRWNNSQELVAASFKVYPVTLDAAGTETKGAALDAAQYTLTDASDADRNGFVLKFNNDVDSAYVIEYDTRATERVDADEKVTNTVTWLTETASAFADIRQLILQKAIASVDYASQIVTWTVTVNADSHAMDNVVLTDTFAKGGLKLDPSSLTVDPAVPYELDATVTDTQGFKLTFKDPLTGPVTIRYATSYDNEWLTEDWLSTDAKFPNHAQVDWTVGADAHKVEVTRTFDPNAQTKNNGYKSGSYNATTKQLSWTVGVNYNRDTLAQAVIQDTLLSGQTLVPGSVKVYEMVIPAGGSPSKGAEVDSASYTVTDAAGELRVAFSAPIDEAYILEFSTELKDVLIDASVTNTAVLWDGAEQASKSLTATVTIPHGGEYVTKSGAQDGDKVKWSIAINRGQSTVHDAVITDTASANQRLIASSFHVYATTVANNGDVTKAAELVKDTDYSVAITTNADGTQTFVVTFLSNGKVIKSAYVLEYQSLIVAENGEAISNDVQFSGNNKVEVTKDTSEEVIVGVSGGSGTGSGVRSTLNVTKTDEKDATEVLSGATFELYRVFGADRILINTITTGADGKAVFTKLLAGDYVLIETVAPEGYKLDKTEHPVAVGASATVTLGITNEKKSTGSNYPYPTDPTDPEPTDPTDPTTPIEPTDPTEPTEPTDPVTEPGEPSDPTEPTDPVGPTNPEPTNPTPTTPQPGTDGSVDQGGGNEGNTGSEDGSGNGTETGGSIDEGFGGTLPKTGDGSHLPVQLTGLAFIVLGFLLFRSRFYRSINK
ncbi:LPXTG-motif cell wall-anchored protein [Paenibacillus phyllosphaerae]|uniref:LPXTG-motif cell wall-anchored protein n=1 Tax=Paenibacillus phyllosphaerae TaxID=274593 RepID=A0A7W5AU99_9BACL|nr:LPXTG cell wall anchor domain-containing protein [Paenibacillus phyllosphaerae]MBB3108905.1 LPXTG-motif cell wall-anchored protein [Paenibacillus phyllosphaerae]